MTTPANAAVTGVPPHPTVLSALQNTPVGPYLGQSAHEVLAGIGLPSLPQVPAVSPFPGVPPLPQLDPMVLLKPITDMFGGFGTGNLAAAAASNPQAVLSNITQAVNAALQLGDAGLGLLQQMQGQGAQSATAGATATRASSVALGNQSTGMHIGVGAASTTVAVGAEQMLAVIAKFVATTVALGPALATPPGQIAMLVNGVDTGTEATAVTASTKAQLAVHAANMTVVGSPVTVTGSGLNSNLGSQLQDLASIGQQVVSIGEQGSQVLAHAQAQPISPGAPAPGLIAAAAEAPGADDVLSGAGPAAVTSPAQRLSPWRAETVGQTPGEAVSETTVPVEALTPAAAVSGVSEPLPPMFGGAAMSSPAAATYSGSPGLVNATYGEELAGKPESALPTPVVGAAEYEFGPPEPGSGR